MHMSACQRLSVTWRWVAVGVVAAAVVTQPAFLHGQSAARERWVGTWSTAMVVRPQTAPVPPPGAPATAAPATTTGRGNGQGPGASTPPLNFNNQTLRQIVHTSIAGDRVRVVFSNEFGTAPLQIGAASIAIRDHAAAIKSDSRRTLTFSGKSSATVPAGAAMLSDPADLQVPQMTDLAIDIYLPGDTAALSSPLTTHAAALQTSYVSAAGNHAGENELPVASTTASWFLLTRVEVSTRELVGAIVAFGDSITDGTRSTSDTNARWPDQLAKRLLTSDGRARMAMLNAAIAGNRILSDGLTVNFGVNALARFDRDVLAQPGATHVIVLEGINDFGMARDSASPTADDIIAGHRQIIARAHAHGLKIIGATLTPFEGAAYFTSVGEAKRQAFNNWIRTSKEYDAVIDFDLAVRDPKEPSKFREDYQSGDHLHPSDLGYQTMANAIDVKLFELK